MKILLSCLLLLLSQFSFAVDFDNKSEMIETLNIIKNSFQVSYAPKDWKKTFNGWNLNDEIDKAKKKILALDSKEIKDFQRILVDFFRSPQDYHVAIKFFSTESAFLPFKIRSAEGRYFITSINHEMISKKEFPYEIGDEIIELDNQKIHDYMTSFIKKEIGKPNEETDKSLGETFITLRSGILGHDVPQGLIAIKIRSQKNNKETTCSLPWFYSEEQIQNRNLTIKNVNGNQNLGILLKKEMSAPFFRHLKKLENDSMGEDHPETLGARKSYIPDLGKKLWESDKENPFYAYIFEGPNKKLIGYVRIAHYYGDDEEVDAFASIISFLQKKTSMLIIDQIDNPGGSLFYLYSLVSMLGEKPFSTPFHRMSITQRDVMASLETIPLLELIENDNDAREILGDKIEGYPVDFQLSQNLLEYFKFIVDEWNHGRTITQSYPLFGVRKIIPNQRICYKKPILILTNALDFSGGDFFPAIMQDSHRALIFGSKTAGAGGFVLSDTFPNFFGIESFNYTASMAERIDQKPIENLGVEPDYPYVLKVADLTKNYVDYIAEIKKIIQTML